MSDNNIAVAKRESMAIVEQVVIKGDLSQLSPVERVTYYKAVCDSLGLNPLTKPFEYLDLDGKLVLYAKRDCTDQLRSSRGVSVTIVSREKIDDVYIVTARATLPDGRSDESIGVVSLAKEDGDWQTAQSGKRFFKGNGQWKPLHGDALANALMKAETKAKRRATLSIVGLGWLDETEIETIPGARTVEVATAEQPTLPPATVQQTMPRPVNGNGQRPASPQMVTRYNELTMQAADLGINAEVLPTHPTAELVAEMGTALKDRIAIRERELAEAKKAS